MHPLILLNGKHPFVEWWTQNRGDAVQSDTMRRFLCMYIQQAYFDNGLVGSGTAPIEALVNDAVQRDGNEGGARQLVRLLSEIKQSVNAHRGPQTIEFRLEKFVILPKRDLAAQWRIVFGNWRDGILESEFGRTTRGKNFWPKWSGRGAPVVAPFQLAWWDLKEESES